MGQWSGVGATRIFPTAAANNFLPHCETLLLRPAQNKVIQPLQGDWIFRNFHRKWFFIFPLQPTLRCKHEPSFPTGVDLKREINICFLWMTRWRKMSRSVFQIWSCRMWRLHRGRRRFIYKEPLKSSKNVVIVNNGTYGPVHNSHSMIYGNLPTGSFDLLAAFSIGIWSVFWQVWNR